METFDILRIINEDNDNIIYINFKDANKYKKKFECVKNNIEWFSDPGFNNSRGVIAIDSSEDAIAGYAFVRNDKMIFSVYVFPEYRRKGLGKKLVQYCIYKFNGNWLEVEKTNTNAINIYKKMGFKIKDSGMCYGDNEGNKKVPCYIMKYID